MTPNAPEILTAESFRRYLIVSLSRFYAGRQTVSDLVAKVMDDIPADAMITQARASQMALDSQIDLLERLRRSRGMPLPIDDLFARSLGPLLKQNPPHFCWKLFLWALQSLEPPCAALIIDHYIAGRDRPLVENIWNIRSNCLPKLRAEVNRRFESLHD